MVKAKKEEIVVFAQTYDRKVKKDIGIKTNDRRQHMYLLGTAKTGKSTMLENMIYQDIYAGRGVAVVDPHGKLASRVLNFIPTHRINDVIYFNPTDREHPFAFNVLEDVDVSYRHFLVVSGLISVFKKMWVDIWGPQLEYTLRNIILALLEYPGSTLLGIMRMLSDEEFRDRVLTHSTDPEVKSFWRDEYPRYPDHLQAEVITPITNRISKLLSVPLVRNIVGQVKSKVNMREVLDKGKIVIIDLSKARIGEDATTLLGAMMTVKIQMAAMARRLMSEDKRRDFYLYIDGFDNFATDSFIETLSEAHTYRLNLVIAHQYIDQLVTGGDTRLRDALFNNVGTMVIYRVSAEDNTFLSKTLFPRKIKKVDLMNLDRHQIYIKRIVDGTVSKPFAAMTLPRMASLEGNKRKIITLSQEQYTEPQKIVEEKIARWRGLISKDEHVSPQGEKDMYQARCDTCKTDIYISFIPDGVRPVFCKKCLKEWENQQSHLPRQEQEYEKKSPLLQEISLEQAMKKDPVSFKKR
ncbi:type IV secretion system DNA-binding domain-containing protein [Patescibacteria group bacterium AH-259-L05]|nr:type IV secretion system DNA-binding domain-containing protein [Patescibacteria group bacterium AH-259-L05]